MEGGGRRAENRRELYIAVVSYRRIESSVDWHICRAACSDKIRVNERTENRSS